MKARFCLPRSFYFTLCVILTPVLQAQMATITGSVNTNSTNRPFVGSAANDGGWGSSLTDPGGSPASTATSSGSFSVVGTATLANGYGDGNGIPTGVTISYDASFTITELNGFNLADGGDNGFGVDSSGFTTAFCPSGYRARNVRGNAACAPWW